jgi:hypothetical protein
MPRSTIDLAVVLRGQRQGGLQFARVVRLGNPHRRAQVGRLDEHRERQARAGLGDVRILARHRHVVYNRQHPFRTDTFHHLLVHGDGGGQHARADVGQAGQFQQALHRAVLAEGAVQHREDHVDFRVRARFGQDGPGSTCPLCR